MFRQTITKEFGCNCWLFVFWWLIRLRLRGIVLVWDGAIPHLCGVTWDNQVVHFKRTKGTPKTCSLWFRGVGETFPVEYLSQLPPKTTKIIFWRSK